MRYCDSDFASFFPTYLFAHSLLCNWNTFPTHANWFQQPPTPDDNSCCPLCVCVCVHVHVVMCLPNWRFNNKTLPSNGTSKSSSVLYLYLYVCLLVCGCSSVWVWVCVLGFSPGLRIYLCDCAGAWVCLRDCVKKGINEPIEIISLRGWVLLFLFLLLQLAWFMDRSVIKVKISLFFFVCYSNAFCIISQFITISLLMSFPFWITQTIVLPPLLKNH